MRNVRSLFKSFLFAFRGLFFVLRNERNMRIHSAVGIYVIFFSFFFDLTRIEYSILILAIALVMTAEIINTAIEEIVDMISPAYDQLARIAKDAAAGAVLITAIAAICVAIGLFWKPWAYPLILDFFLTRPMMIILLALSVVVAVIYILWGPYRIRTFLSKKRKRNDAAPSPPDA